MHPCNMHINVCTLYMSLFAHVHIKRADGFSWNKHAATLQIRHACCGLTFCYDDDDDEPWLDCWRRLLMIVGIVIVHHTLHFSLTLTLACLSVFLPYRLLTAATTIIYLYAVKISMSRCHNWNTMNSQMNLFSALSQPHIFQLCTVCMLRVQCTRAYCKMNNFNAMHISLNSLFDIPINRIEIYSVAYKS